VEVFKDLAKNFRFPQDLLDMFIIYLMLYYAYQWFRKASSRFILIGLGILAMIYKIANLLQLYLTAYVLKAFSAVFLFAIIVIFQEEIKRFFERVAVLGFFKRHTKSVASSKDIDLIMSTVAGLAKKHIGALIVIKGRDPLERHLKGGALLEGEISQFILESIFDPHSSGHDGAVVIEGGRISRFGCHLPLSTNFHKIGIGGTRHMAALGLAERTDALCIVVSEERGAISVAHEERVKQNVKPDDLNVILKRFYEVEKETAEDRSFKHWFTRNVHQKLAIVLLTCIVWLFFGYHSESVRETFMVDINYNNIPEDINIDEPKIEKAVVILEGPERAFFLLDRKTLEVSVDMATVKPGKHEILIQNAMLKRPPNLSVISIEPDKYIINAMKMVKASIPVIVPVEGILSEKLSLIEYANNPASVFVMIPEAMKKDKSLKILTEPLNFSKIQKTCVVKRKIKLNRNMYLVQGQPDEVEVLVEVKKKDATAPETPEPTETEQEEDKGETNTK
jgi:uncharacterized protein (TIGR00159 family)